MSRTLTGVYEPNPGLASPKSIALQSAMEAIGLLGESLAASQSVEQIDLPNQRSTAAYSTAIYNARTTLMSAQAQLYQGVHVLASEGFDAAQPKFTSAGASVSNAVSLLQAASAEVPAS